MEHIACITFGSFCERSFEFDYSKSKRHLAASKNYISQQCKRMISSVDKKNIWNLMNIRTKNVVW